VEIQHLAQRASCDTKQQVVENTTVTENGDSYSADPNVEVALVEQRAEVIVKIECHFVHLIRVDVDWKHALATVGDLCINNVMQLPSLLSQSRAIKT